MEHLDRLAKDANKNLVANKTERAIEQAIGTIAPLLQHFDLENNIKQCRGGHLGANEPTVALKCCFFGSEEAPQYF